MKIGDNIQLDTRIRGYKKVFVWIGEETLLTVLGPINTPNFGENPHSLRNLEYHCFWIERDWFNSYFLGGLSPCHCQASINTVCRYLSLSEKSMFHMIDCLNLVLLQQKAITCGGIYTSRDIYLYSLLFLKMLNPSLSSIDGMENITRCFKFYVMPIPSLPTKTIIQITLYNCPVHIWWRYQWTLFSEPFEALLGAAIARNALPLSSRFSLHLGNMSHSLGHIWGIQLS